MHTACKKAFARNKDEADPKKIEEMIARGKKILKALKKLF